MQSAVDDGALAVAVPADVTIDRPRSRDHGDYASPVALQLAKAAGAAPRQVADLLAERLRGADGIASVEVAGPGFLNITVDVAAAGALAGEIVEALSRRADTR